MTTYSAHLQVELRKVKVLSDRHKTTFGTIRNMKNRKASNSMNFGYEPDAILAREQIRELIKTLNRFRIKAVYPSRPVKVAVVRLDFSAKQEELRRLVEHWTQSGPNLRKMFEELPELKTMTRHGITTFWPTTSGRGHLDWNPRTGDNAKLTPKEQAVQEFMFLATNPEWGRLGGPCFRCGDYFWKKDKRHIVYCSRFCSARHTALSAVKRGRQRRHSLKLEAAQLAMAEWSKGNRKEDWKKWVERQTHLKDLETRCSVAWLTRRINKDELSAPDALRGVNNR